MNPNQLFCFFVSALVICLLSSGEGRADENSNSTEVDNMTPEERNTERQARFILFSFIKKLKVKIALKVVHEIYSNLKSWSHAKTSTTRQPRTTLLTTTPTLSTLVTTTTPRLTTTRMPTTTQQMSTSTAMLTDTTLEVIEPTTEPPTLPQNCTETGDLILIVDTSEKFTRSDYKNVLEFVGQISRGWRNHQPNLVEDIYFTDNRAYYSLDLPDSIYLTGEEIYQRITQRPYDGTSTQGQVSFGINLATRELVYHRRSGVRWNLLVITGSSGNVWDTETAASNYFQYADTRAIAIGRGESANAVELFSISNKQADHVFMLENSTDLFQILGPVSRLLC